MEQFIQALAVILGFGGAATVLCAVFSTTEKYLDRKRTIAAWIGLACVLTGMILTVVFGKEW